MARKDILEKNKVLFFDDESFIANYLAKSLESFGWNVRLVSSAEELIEELSDLYDILILDIMAPVPESDISSMFFSKTEIKDMENGMSTGIVLAKKIWEQNKNIPILFLSARSRPDAVTRFIDEGRRCYWLRKPELAKTINEKLLELLNS